MPTKFYYYVSSWSTILQKGFWEEGREFGYIYILTLNGE